LFIKIRKKIEILRIYLTTFAIVTVVTAGRISFVAFVSFGAYFICFPEKYQLMS